MADSPEVPRPLATKVIRTIPAAGRRTTNCPGRCCHRPGHCNSTSHAGRCFFWLARSGPLAHLLVGLGGRLRVLVVDGPLALLGRHLAQGTGHLADVRPLAAAAAADVVDAQLAGSPGEVARAMCQPAGSDRKRLRPGAGSVYSPFERLCDGSDHLPHLLCRGVVMRTFRRSTPLLLVLLLVVGLIVSSQAGDPLAHVLADPMGDKTAIGLPVGIEAPEIEGKDIDGKWFKLSDHRGKVVVLDCWVDG